MDYPALEDTIEILVEAARKAAHEHNLMHPEDIAVAMSTAIEYSWPVVLESYKRFK